MVRILSRSLALVFAVTLVGGASWALSRPYLIDIGNRWGPTIVCICFWFPTISTAEDWPQFDAGAFRVRAPKGTLLNRTNAYHGVIIDPRFALTYDLDDRAPNADFAKSGRYFREEEVTVGGRAAVIRTAEFPGRSEPFFVQLIVPRAVQAKDGRWLALEIHGWATTPDRSWLAGLVVRSVDFAPVYDKLVMPPRSHADPPIIEIDYPPAKETP